MNSRWNLWLFFYQIRVSFRVSFDLGPPFFYCFCGRLSLFFFPATRKSAAGKRLFTRRAAEKKFGTKRTGKRQQQPNKEKVVENAGNGFGGNPASPRSIDSVPRHSRTEKRSLFIHTIESHPITERRVRLRGLPGWRRQKTFHPRLFFLVVILCFFVLFLILCVYLDYGLRCFVN